MKQENYYEVAANWWATQILSSKDFRFTNPNLQHLVEFEKILSLEIKKIISMNGFLDISTCDSRNKLLDKIAIDTNLDLPIPSGFEMKIIFSTIFIYNSKGVLEAYY
ncbi:MAG: hypothetical protein IJE05_00025 [Clostridia bacterium]|nr:hypothetical protein [Clostridia bacterium]